jgi:type IV pilus assembly protein PilV
LESLIAVVVIAIGFIGAARLQTLGLSMGNSSIFRERAVLLVSEMEDRIRANQPGYTAGSYNNLPSNTATAPGCVTSTCSSAQLATHDYAAWLSEMQSPQLPGGKGYVCIDSTPNDGAPGAPACDGLGSVLAVKVCWTEKLGPVCLIAPVRPFQ